MAGKCFKCTSGNCALMGYDATLPITTTVTNSSENDIIPSSGNALREPAAPQPGKYFLATGKDYPFCRKLKF